MVSAAKREGKRRTKRARVLMNAIYTRPENRDRDAIYMYPDNIRFEIRSQKGFIGTRPSRLQNTHTRTRSELLRVSYVLWRRASSSSCANLRE